MVDDSWGIAGRLDIPIWLTEMQQVGDTTLILDNRQVFRYDSSGQLISQTSPPYPTYTYLFDDALSPDGTVYEIRSDQSTFGNVRLVRYSPDGSQDMNWGDHGEVDLSGAFDLQSVDPLSIEPDGSILVASAGGKKGAFGVRLTYVAVVSASGVVRYQRNLGPSKADDEAMRWSIDVHEVNGVLPLRSGRAVIFGNGDRSMFAIRICGTTANCPTISDPHLAYLSGSPWADSVTDNTFRRLPRNLRLLAGDDEVDIIEPIRHAFTINGGSGDDYLSVAGIHLRLIGGAGNDTIIVAQSQANYQAGSGVRAQISAGPGDDRIDTAGYAPGAHIRCGSGQDLVVANPGDKVSRDCERVVRPQYFTPTGSFSWEQQLHL